MNASKTRMLSLYFLRWNFLKIQVTFRTIIFIPGESGFCKTSQPMFYVSSNFQSDSLWASFLGLKWTGQKSKRSIVFCFFFFLILFLPSPHMVRLFWSLWFSQNVQRYRLCPKSFAIYIFILYLLWSLMAICLKLIRNYNFVVDFF